MLVSGVEQRWTNEIFVAWSKHVVPLFKEGETCSDANYFTPRPYVDEYNKGSPYYGFTYTVQPKNDVAQVRWKLNEN